MQLPPAHVHMHVPIMCLHDMHYMYGANHVPIHSRSYREVHKSSTFVPEPAKAC